MSLKIEYKLGVMVYRCLHDRAPRYFADHLIPASDAAPRRLRLQPLTTLFLAADLARTAVGLFITLARHSGTRCQMKMILENNPLLQCDQRRGFLTRCAIFKIYVLLTFYNKIAYNNTIAFSIH